MSDYLKGFFNNNDNHDDEDENEILPNGYSRKDYTDVGFSDSDIETWGLDQPSAPSPSIAPFIISDMMDGELDGNFDFPFS